MMFDYELWGDRWWDREQKKSFDDGMLWEDEEKSPSAYLFASNMNIMRNRNLMKKKNKYARTR